MQTSIALNISKAIKGMAVLAPKRCRPLQLRSLPQILRLTITAGAGADNVVLTLTDVKTGYVFPTLTVTGNANEATLGAAIRAAWAASPKHNQLMSVAAVTESSGSDLVLDFTARNPNIEYRLVRVGGPDGAAATSTAAETQAEGGSGLEFGQLVVRGTNDDEFAVLSASSTVRDIVGALIRTDGNHYQDIPIGASDLCPRGVHMPIAEDVEFWVQPIEAVTPASRPHVCVEAATGRVVGDWGDTPQGGQQLWTLTPTASENSFGIEFDYLGVHYSANSGEPDGSTTATEICDGLRVGLGTIAGLTIGGTATLTIQTAAGTEITNLRSTDEGVFATITETTGEDVDMLDVSSIARYTSSGAAGEFVKVKLMLAP